MTILTRIRHAWAAMMGRIVSIETDAEAELLQLHARLLHAVRYLKDVPMELQDDITALGTAITTALAAKDAAAAQTVQDLANANATIASLQTQIANADAQILALTASITPAPVADPAPAQA